MRQLRFVGVSKQFGYAEHVFSSYVLPNQIHYLGYEIVGADPRWVCADDDHPTRAVSCAKAEIEAATMICRGLGFASPGDGCKPEVFYPVIGEALRLNSLMLDPISPGECRDAPRQGVFGPVDFSRTFIFWSIPGSEGVSETQRFLDGRGNHVRLEAAAILDILLPAEMLSAGGHRFTLIRPHRQEEVYGQVIYQQPSREYRVIFEERGLCEKSVSPSISTSAALRSILLRAFQEDTYKSFRTHVTPLAMPRRLESAMELISTANTTDRLVAVTTIMLGEVKIVLRYPINAINFQPDGSFQINTGPITVPLHSSREDAAFWSNFHAHHRADPKSAIRHLDVGYIAWNSNAPKQAEIIYRVHQRFNQGGFELPPMWTLEGWGKPLKFCATHELFGDQAMPETYS